MTPAELLREAANRIERRAQNATGGPWFKMDNTVYWTDSDANWIALMHPGTAGPLAALLRAEADDMQEGDCSDSCPGITCVASRNLALAILGEEP